MFDDRFQAASDGIKFDDKPKFSYCATSDGKFYDGDDKRHIPKRQKTSSENLADPAPTFRFVFFKTICLFLRKSHAFFVFRFKGDCVCIVQYALLLNCFVMYFSAFVFSRPSF